MVGEVTSHERGRHARSEDGAIDDPPVPSGADRLTVLDVVDGLAEWPPSERPPHATGTVIHGGCGVASWSACCSSGDAGRDRLHAATTKPGGFVSDHLGAVDITFRHMTPSDELVYFIRRHCRRADACWSRRADWWVIVVREAARARFRVRVMRADPQARAEVVELDPDPFLAVRNAFGILSTRIPEAGGPGHVSGVFSTGRPAAVSP